LAASIIAVIPARTASGRWFQAAAILAISGGRLGEEVPVGTDGTTVGTSGVGVGSNWLGAFVVAVSRRRTVDPVVAGSSPVALARTEVATSL